MELPINHKDLDTIINALSLGGDTRLYFVLKNIRDNNRLNRDIWDNNKLNDVWDEVECDI